MVTQKKTNGKKQLKTILNIVLPEHLAFLFGGQSTKNIADFTNTELKNVADKISKIEIAPAAFKLHNFKSAEVTRGGVDTSQISSKTMESKLCGNLYFIGEVLDIAGDLGGYNLQWAWSTAHAVDL